jgi:hypothetical protein
MTTGNMVSQAPSAMPNGSGAAAVLSAGIGSLAVAVFAIAADKSSFVKNLFISTSQPDLTPAKQRWPFFFGSQSGRFSIGGGGSEFFL